MCINKSSQLQRFYKQRTTLSSQIYIYYKVSKTSTLYVPITGCILNNLNGQLNHWFEYKSKSTFFIYIYSCDFIYWNEAKRVCVCTQLIKLVHSCTSSIHSVSSKLWILECVYKNSTTEGCQEKCTTKRKNMYAFV